MVELLGVEQAFDVVVVYGAERHEILLGLVLHHCWYERVDLAGCAKEHFALAVLHILLYVECDGFGDAEVLHVLGDCDAHLLGEVEVVVDGVTRCEDYGCEVQQADLLLAEFFGTQSLDLDERAEHEFYAKVLGDIEVG